MGRAWRRHVVNDSPQPHCPLELGLINTNSDLWSRDVGQWRQSGQGTAEWRAVQRVLERGPLRACVCVCGCVGEWVRKHGAQERSSVGLDNSRMRITPRAGRARRGGGGGSAGGSHTETEWHEDQGQGKDVRERGGRGGGGY